MERDQSKEEANEGSQARRRAVRSKEESTAAASDQRRYDDLAALERAERRKDGSSRSLTPERRREILDNLFFEGQARGPYVRQFYVLLSISVVIATLGLATDNPAVVIGGMLIAPLMTPILAVAAAAIMGWPIRLFRLMIRLVLASAFAFGLAFALPYLFNVPVELVVPRQILARANPELPDLLIGLAAGAAGAYMLVRREAVTALPGVAAAVALVPPLCASAYLAYLERYEMAVGAFYLFVTNLSAIVASACVVLMIMGFTPRPPEWRFHLRVLLGLVGALAFVALVGVPLAQRTVDELEDLRSRAIVVSVAQEWIGKSEVELIKIDVDDDLVSITVNIKMKFRELSKKGLYRYEELLPPQLTSHTLRQMLEERLKKKIRLRLQGGFNFYDAS